jgi:hypothetical protein
MKSGARRIYPILTSATPNGSSMTTSGQEEMADVDAIAVDPRRGDNDSPTREENISEEERVIEETS